MRLRAHLAIDANPLRRRSDRIETTALWVAVLLALAVLPFSVLAAAVTMQQGSAAAARTRTSRLLANAVVESQPHAVFTGGSTAQYEATLTWTDRAGISHRTLTSVDSAARRGLHVRIWTDSSSGELAQAPMTRGDVITGAVTIGLVMELLAVALGALGFAGVRFLLDRCRYREIDEQWRQFNRIAHPEME